MLKVSFFTAIDFGNLPKSKSQKLLETVDSYFYLAGRKAFVIQGETKNGSEGCVLSDYKPSYLKTALKVISYFTVILPIIMLLAKAVLRSLHRFHLIDPRQRLEEGISLSAEEKEKVQNTLLNHFSNAYDLEVTWYGGNSQVFSLPSIPRLIFKIPHQNRGVVRRNNILSGQEVIESRYENMVKAKEICLAHRLNFLIVPHAKMYSFNINGKVITLIAEEKLNIQQNESAQERLYQSLSGLNETAQQLAIFIAKTGFSDVVWRNIPIVNTTETVQGSRRVALIDLEEMESASDGIFGGAWGRRGLIRCMFTNEQIDIVLKEASRHGITSSFITAQQAKEDRLKEIKEDEELLEYYTSNNIWNNSTRPIEVQDLTSLGLDLDEKESYTVRYFEKVEQDAKGKVYGEIKEKNADISMREVIIDVIKKINEAIKKNPAESSVKGRRYILLNTNYGSNTGDQCGLSDYCYRFGVPKYGMISEAQANNNWLLRIVNKLVEKRHLFKLVKTNGHGFFIQA